jgi:hypothetical protein
MNTNAKTAVGYVSRRQDNRRPMMHPEFQKKAIKAHCAANGLALFNIFEDYCEDVSSLKFALEAIHAGLADTLLICRMDLLPAVELPPIQFLAIEDQRPGESETKALQEKVNDLVVGYENNVKARRSARSTKVDQEHKPYRNRSTFGLKDDRERMTLGLIARWHLEGASRGDIVHRLNAAGLLTRRGCLWTYAQIGAIFLDVPRFEGTLEA